MHKLKPKNIKLNEKSRLYSCKLPIIGLTGGIASGKSKASEYLKKLGLFTIDADQLVKDIYKKESTVKLLNSLVPEVLNNGIVDFKLLRKIFYSNENVKIVLEKHIYSLLGEAFSSEANKAIEQKKNFIIYEVPLLFEKSLQNKLDITLCTHASLKLQSLRIKKRDNSDQETIEKMLKSQMSTDFKISLADYSISNNGNFEELYRELDSFLLKVTE